MGVLVAACRPAKNADDALFRDIALFRDLPLFGDVAPFGDLALLLAMILLIAQNSVFASSLSIFTVITGYGFISLLEDSPKLQIKRV